MYVLTLPYLCSIAGSTGYTATPGAELDSRRKNRDPRAVPYGSLSDTIHNTHTQLPNCKVPEARLGKSRLVSESQTEPWRKPRKLANPEMTHTPKTCPNQS